MKCDFASSSCRWGDQAETNSQRAVIDVSKAKTSDGFYPITIEVTAHVAAPQMSDGDDRGSGLSRAVTIPSLFAPVPAQAGTKVA
jgi:hypothetical protein